MGADAERIQVWRFADFPGEDQLVLASVERTLPGRGLVPDDEVLQLAKDRLPGGQHLAHVAPVHAHEHDGAVDTDGRDVGRGLLQERDELLPRLLAGGDEELAMLGTAPPLKACDLQIVRRVGESHPGLVAGHQGLDIRARSGVAAHQAMLTQRHRSPPRDTACVCSSGAASSASGKSAPKSCTITSISAGSKPVAVRSRPSRSSSSASSANSLASASRSQPAFSVSLLSAIANRRLWASLSPTALIVGTISKPSSFAAASRPCPARITSFSSTTIG